VPMIMLMARWGSDVIMRYIADAPLRNITSDFMRGSAGSSSEAPPALDDSWLRAADAHADDPPSDEAITDALTLLEPAAATAAAGRFALNVATNYLHVVAKRACWERAIPNRTQCGRDYLSADWDIVQSVIRSHERDGVAHMVFRCGSCAKPSTWVEMATALDEVLSDSD
jgi:hypothetical protein